MKKRILLLAVLLAGSAALFAVQNNSEQVPLSVELERRAEHADTLADVFQFHPTARLYFLGRASAYREISELIDPAAP